VYADGRLEFRAASGKVHKRRVSVAQLAELRASVRSPRFSTVLRQLVAEDYARRYHDHPGLTLEVPGVAAYVPSEKLTEDVLSTLRILDEVFGKAFGRSYDWPTVSPSP
jgi:hypothetical protein